MLLAPVCLGWWVQRRMGKPTPSPSVLWELGLQARDYRKFRGRAVSVASLALLKAQDNRIGGEQPGIRDIWISLWVSKREDRKSWPECLPCDGRARGYAGARLLGNSSTTEQSIGCHGA